MHPVCQEVFPMLPLLTACPDLLSHCQNPNSMYKMDAMLPCEHIETIMFSNNKDDDPHTTIGHCSYLVHHPTVGLWHVTNILSMLVDISMESATSYDAAPAFQDYLAWILDSLLVSHELQKRWRTSPQLQESCKKSSIMSFCTVFALVSSLRDFLTKPMLRKSYILLSVLCADLLEAPANMSETPLRSTICSSILNLATICAKDQVLQRAVCLHLVPAIEVCLADEVTRASMDKDLQVCSSSDAHMNIY